MVQTEKTINDSKRVREMVGMAENARLFVLDVLQTMRYLFDKGLVSAYDGAKKELRYLIKRFTVLDYVCGNLSLLALLMSLLVILSGFGLLGYQIVIWLQDGVWNAMPLMMVFDYLFENTALGGWMQNPGSWLGLHQMLKWGLDNTPISLVLIFNGLILSAGMSAIIGFAVMIRRFQFRHRDE